MRGKLKTPKRKKILRIGIEAGWAPGTVGNQGMQQKQEKSV